LFRSSEALWPWFLIHTTCRWASFFLGAVPGVPGRSRDVPEGRLRPRGSHPGCARQAEYR
jgi:hypothetical protein